MELEDIFPKDEIRRLSDSDWRHRMLFDKEPQVIEMRNCVKRLADFAERQGILDADMIGRLQNQDYEQFRSAIHEFAVAEFLSPIGNIDWHPPGRDLRIGEFEIRPINHDPIFVEAKTIFESEELKRKTRNWEQIKQITHGINSPFLINLEFLELQCEIVPRRFRSWFRQVVRKLTLVMMRLDETKKLIFEDVSSDGAIIKIKVQFTKILAHEQPTLCSMTWTSEKKELHERVKEVIDGALEQLPDTKPTLVIVVPSGPFGIDEFQMLAVMFSFPKITLHSSIAISEQKPSIHYDLQGVIQQLIRTRLSAVGVWHHKWTEDPQGSLDVYHNPLRARKISHQVLELPNVCQLIPKGEGIMEWMPNRPPQ